jgi:hypothetical protein
MKKNKLLIIVPIILISSILAIILVNTKYVSFKITADLEGEPLEKVYGKYEYFKSDVPGEAKLYRCYMKPKGNTLLTMDIKINNESGSRYMYPVQFYVDGEIVYGYFRFENINDGINESWKNNVDVHFYYEDGILKEYVSCSDGEVVELKRDDDRAIFDVTIRK